MAFKFRDNAVNLDFDGKEFTLDPFDEDVLTKIEEVGLKANKISGSLKDKPAKEQINDMMDFMVESIDSILGKGTIKEIFGKRKIRFCDLLDIFSYIADEMKKGRDTIIDRYSPERLKK